MAITILDDVKKEDPRKSRITAEEEPPDQPPKKPDEEPLLDPDPDPQWGPESITDRLFPDEDAAPPRHVSSAIRKDVHAKTSMMLMILGGTWAHRDPYCGSIFGQSIPDRMAVDEDGNRTSVPGIATALTDIFCDSPDIVKWFTASGRYMKWLTLASSLQPIAGAVLRHHITHSQESEDQVHDWSLYEAV